VVADVLGGQVVLHEALDVLEAGASPSRTKISLNVEESRSGPGDEANSAAHRPEKISQRRNRCIRAGRTAFLDQLLGSRTWAYGDPEQRVQVA
jgi:hypothetical protein